MFEDYYFDDPALQDALAAAGYYTDPARAPAVMPSTVQAAEPIMGIGSPAAVAPMTYEELADRRAAANTPPPGTSIVGPTANGKPLSFGDDNTFGVREGQEVRVVDAKGNVIFSGSGVEGANRAVAVAQSLSDDLGKKANFAVQAGEFIAPTGETRFYDVARAAPKQSGLGFLADNVLPFAAAFIPGIGPIAGAALGSAVSSAAQGRGLKDALVRAAIAGGSAYAGGQLFGPATPGAGAPMTGANADLIPNALKGLNFGSLTSAAIPAGIGGAAGDILVNAAGRAASNLAGSAVGSALGQAAASQIGAPNKNNVVDGIDQDTGEIVAEAQRRTGLSPSGAGIGAALANPVINGIDQVTGEIVAEGSKIERPTDATLPNLDLGLIDRLSGMENYGDDIVVEGSRIVRPEPEFVVPDIGLGIGSITDSLSLPKADPKLTEKTTLEKIKDAANIANAVSVLVPVAGGVLGGGGGGGTLSPDTSGLTFTKSPLRPTIPGGVGIGGVGGGYPYTPETYGRRGGDQETEYVFFTRDPVTGAPMVPVTAPATAPAGPPGKKEGGEIDDDMVKHLVDYHKNGGHQGPGQVKGIGSGQEDKIPAYLSDGEYVWSAQDVSDLGDGSNREGVRRLDEMRKMVRQQAGRKDVKKIAKPQKGIDRMLKAVGGMA
jgi:hypothetical protein